jgi:hypothetical protein
VYHHVLQIADDVRGVTSSSARREAPSSVFGISTPGPLDRSKGAKRERIGTIQSPTANTVPVSRLGGTQFVMDDGDSRYLRKDNAGNLKYDGAYIDVVNENKVNDLNIPKDEHFRIRTRTGHQILMHNAEDLIYIGNSKGTTWIELSSNGKIDIFADDSISIHTKNDMNFRADRDMNFEAGRNINIKTTAEYQDNTDLLLYGQESDVVDAASLENGRIQIGKIQTRNEWDENGHLEIKVMGDMKIAVRDPDIEDGVKPSEVTGEDPLPEGVKGLHIRSYENTRIHTLADLDLNTVGKNAFTAGGTTDINSGGNHTETAPQIHMNGPTARVAEEITIDEIPKAVKVLPTFENEITSPELDWPTLKYKSPITLTSIMNRIPMHEPWSGHENLDPILTNKLATNREIEPEE